MSNADTRLPPGFEAQEALAAAWAIAGADNRRLRRIESGKAEREAFFQALTPVVPAALEYLDRKPLEAFDETEKRLMDMLLTYAHVALAVELQGDDEPKHALGARRVTITRALSDL